MLMGSHWRFFFPLKRISSQTYCRECRVYFMITWASGPAPQANGPKVILTSRDPLKSAHLCELFKGHYWWRTTSPNSWPFSYSTADTSLPSHYLLANQHFVCLSKIPSGTGQAMVDHQGLMKHVPLVIVLTDCFAKAVISGRERKLGYLMAP